MQLTNPRFVPSSNIIRCLLLIPALLAGGCEPGEPAAQAGPAKLAFKVSGKLQSRALDEASGLQALPDGELVLHNDDGAKLYLSDTAGMDLGTIGVDGASNRDWEDLTLAPGENGDLLVIGDIGDNNHVRKHISLYFVRPPLPADKKEGIPVVHRVRLRYPDGPRDAESLAYDAESDRLLIMSKRDKPPRLYGVQRDLALWKDELQLEYLGDVPGFRPPDRADMLRHPLRGQWVSQPTGMDIRLDGTLAAVLTYRSLYLFRRAEGEGWPEAFRRKPVEVPGPPGIYDEAVGFSRDGRSIYVTTERRPAPLYRLDLPDKL
ncbi:MAG: hypothetical protein PVI46_04470 [Lysobacterales bacterium]